MVEITKEFNFSMAHILENHLDKCLNLHGHTYRLLVTASKEKLDDGMVIDFNELKKIVKEKFINKVDHSFGYNSQSNDPVVNGIVKILQDNGRKTYKFNFRTTCEEMAKYIYDLLLLDFENLGIILKEIKLYEGCDSYAIYKK